MDETRHSQYRHLRTLIGKTDLQELPRVEGVPPGEIYVKCEFMNPTGSHYDRIMLDLLEGLENHGDFGEGATLLDTTTGNSGAALSWLSRVLGFRAVLILPSDAPSARRAQIESYGAEVVPSAAGRYVKGILSELQAEKRRRPGAFLVNHAANEEFPPKTMERLGQEIASQLRETGVDRVDFVVCALGNGASLHIATPLEEMGAKLIAFEPLECATYFLRRFSSEESQVRYGAAAGVSPLHGLWGTGAGEVSFAWPLAKLKIDAVADIELVARKDWAESQREVADRYGLHVGRTSAAGMVVARRLLEKSPGARVVVIAYDQAWKYLDLAGTAGT